METIMTDCEIIGNPKLSLDANSASQGAASPTITATRQPEVRKIFAPTPKPFTGSPCRSGSSGRTSSSSMSIMSNGNTSLHNPNTNASYKPSPIYKKHGAVVRNDAPAHIIPVAALNPYQGRWAIKARVTAKGDLRRYNNAKGDGKVFSFDLLDSDGGEIRITCFNAVVDRFYELIKVGKVYLISKGNLKPAQKNFNHLKNEWEIVLDATSTVDPCPDDDRSIPERQFDFKSINEIENVENNSIIDIIGIVTNVNPTTTILRKNGMETQKRIVILKDNSGLSVDLTLWGDVCNREGENLQEMLVSGSFPVLAVKAGKVNDFSGKSVGTISTTQLFVNPDTPVTQILIQWFNEGGKDFASHSISRDLVPGSSHNEIRKTISQIKDENLGQGDKPDWVTLKATISFIKTDNFYYTACPLMIGDRKCSKKVTKVASGNWCCDRCDQEFELCDYRYLLQIQVQDHTGLAWLTAFQESGEEILCCSAKNLHLLKYEQDHARFAEIMHSCLFEKYIFKLKIKEEIYGDEQKVKITVVKAEKVKASLENRYLLTAIKDFVFKNSKTQKIY